MLKDPIRDEIPPGTLYMLILKTLARSGEMHGFEIANSIQQISDDVLQVEEGSLYPALQRMLLKGWVTAEWGYGREPPGTLLQTYEGGTKTVGSRAVTIPACKSGDHTRHTDGIEEKSHGMAERILAQADGATPTQTTGRRPGRGNAPSCRTEGAGANPRRGFTRTSSSCRTPAVWQSNVAERG
jgi:DNA-binding PadR family transcriptional regulator